MVYCRSTGCEVGPTINQLSDTILESLARQTWDVSLTLFCCWASVVDPTANQRWADVACFLGIYVTCPGCRKRYRHISMSNLLKFSKLKRLGGMTPIHSFHDHARRHIPIQTLGPIHIRLAYMISFFFNFRLKNTHFLSIFIRMQGKSRTYYVYTWRMVKCKHSIGPYIDAVGLALGRQVAAD